MPLDITNPDVIKFLVESYEKTSRLRMKWNTLNESKLRQTATMTDEKGYFDTDIIKEAMAEGMASIKRDYISGARNRRQKALIDGIHVPNISDLKKGHSIVDIGLGDPEKDPRLARPDTDLTIDPIMRPVDPKQHRIIYKGRPRFGREVYLKSRNKIAPEDKFYFPECTGWDHGWRLKDTPFGKSSPQYGRVWRLTRGQQSRSGPRPDPPYYRSPDSEANKCVL